MSVIATYTENYPLSLILVLHGEAKKQCAGLLESRASGLGLLKSTFNAEYFILRLSWSISSNFGAIHSWNACRSPKSRKIHQNPLFWGFKVIDVNIPKKLITSACCDKQHVCLSATISTLDDSIPAKNFFRGGTPLLPPRLGDPLDLGAWNFVPKY